MLDANITDRAIQLTTLQDTAHQMVAQIEQAVRAEAGDIAVYSGSMDADTFVHQSMADAEIDLKIAQRYQITALQENPSSHGHPDALWASHSCSW